MYTRSLPAWVLAVLVLLPPALVNANTVSYGDLIGTKTEFLGVQESSGTDTAPLFGTPKLSGNSLIFSHMTFSSYATNGASDTTDGQLDATIQSVGNPGYYIDKLTLQEVVDTTLTGTGTSATYSSVGTSVFLQILQVDNVDLSVPEWIDLNMTMSESGQWTLANGPLNAHSWNGALTVDLSTILAGDGIPGHATQVAFEMDNSLATASEANTTAYIAKKAEGLSVTPIILPEPSALSLLVLSGVLLMAGRFGRKH